MHTKDLGVLYVLMLITEENIRSVHAYVSDLKERVAKLQYQKQLLASRVSSVSQSDVSSNC